MNRHVASIPPQERAAHAGRVLPPAVRDFVQGGSGHEEALRLNSSDLTSVRVTPRVLRCREDPSSMTRVLGRTLDAPVAVAPMAYQKLLHPDGEQGLAAAAGSAGVPYVMSTLSSTPMEAIAETVPELWFQLYVMKNREATFRILDRAQAAGCAAVMVTVDVPAMPRRWRDIQNSFGLPEGIVPENVLDLVGGPPERRAHVSAIAEHTSAELEDRLTWEDMEILRRHTQVPLMVKGILDPEDARRALDIGMDGVVVSNHGGRQCDAAISAVRALPRVRAALPSDYPVLVDGGFTTADDVAKGLAVGADVVMVGRALLWALALDGRRGATQALDQLTDDLRTSMRLMGAPDVASLRELSWELRT